MLIFQIDFDIIDQEKQARIVRAHLVEADGEEVTEVHPFEVHIHMIYGDEESSNKNALVAITDGFEGGRAAMMTIARVGVLSWEMIVERFRLPKYASEIWSLVALLRFALDWPEGNEFDKISYMLPEDETVRDGEPKATRDKWERDFQQQLERVERSVQSVDAAPGEYNPPTDEELDRAEDARVTL